MCKNPPPPEPIRCREMLVDIEGKLPIVLVKPNSRRRRPMPSVEFLQRKSPPPALHAMHRRLRVSKKESPSRCDPVGANRAEFAKP
jgi:hypothetical protein